MSGVSPASILPTIAKRLRARISKCEAYDPNVCRFTVDAEHQWKPVVVSGYPFSLEARLVHNRRRVTVSANLEYFRIRVEGELAVGVLSINKTDEVLFLERTDLLVRDDSRWPVFIRTNNGPSNELRSFLASSALHSAVESLLQNKDDSLHVFQGAVVLYAKGRDADGSIDNIETLAKLVGPFRRNASSSHLKTLPSRFHHLIPFILEWAESDDGERNALLDQSSGDSLGELVRIVSPDLAEIDLYLDSFRSEPMPDAAIALGRLAELVVDAKLRLSTPGSSER